MRFILETFKQLERIALALNLLTKLEVVLQRDVVSVRIYSCYSGYSREHCREYVLLMTLKVILQRDSIEEYRVENIESLLASQTFTLGTGWRRCRGCLKLKVSSRTRATNYRALLRKMTYEDKASYESSPPGISRRKH